MTALTKEQIDALPGLVARATPGRRVQFMPDYCPEAKGTPFSDWDSSHDTSVILPDGTRYRGYARHRHARDAELDGLALPLAATVIEQQAEIERLREALESIAKADVWGRSFHAVMNGHILTARAALTPDRAATNALGNIAHAMREDGE